VGGPPLDSGLGVMEAGGVGRARDMGMSSSDRQGQLVRERERERELVLEPAGMWGNGDSGTGR
jgi:hypothetical protein